MAGPLDFGGTAEVMKTCAVIRESVKFKDSSRDRNKSPCCRSREGNAGLLTDVYRCSAENLIATYILCGLQKPFWLSRSLGVQCAARSLTPVQTDLCD